jgi:hypothetical protein
LVVLLVSLGVGGFARNDVAASPTQRGGKDSHGKGLSRETKRQKKSARNNNILNPTNPAPRATALVGGLRGKGGILIADMSSEVAYLQSAQLPSGAFRRRPNEPEIVPYWGNYATIGLGAAAAKSRDAAEMGWRWLQWYGAHQDAKTGYVQDHILVNGAEVATGFHDSTDAYAGTFLVAVESMYEGTKCRTCVVRLRRAITLAVDAIRSTQDLDGLTWAQPKGRVKYLTDQAEVGAGLRSGQRLAGIMGDESLMATVAITRGAHDRGLSSMLNPANGPLVWALADTPETAAEFGLSSTRVTVEPGRLYPDAFGPVSIAALIPELTAATVGVGVSQRYVAQWPKWTEDPDVWGFPVLVIWALEHSGDEAAAVNGANRMHEQIVNGYRGAALTVGHVGQLLAIAS